MAGGGAVTSADIVLILLAVGLTALTVVLFRE
jgi:hypothetical protein